MTSIALTSVAGLIILATALAKIFKAKPVMEKLRKAGVERFVYLLAAVEILALALWLYPPTSGFGFLFLSCFFAGAIATELKEPKETIAPIVILILIWIATYFKDPSLFGI